MNQNKDEVNQAAQTYNLGESTEDTHGAASDDKNNQFIAFMRTASGVLMQFKIKLGEGKLIIFTMKKLIEKKVIDLT